MDSDNNSYHSENEFYYPDEISYFLNKNCLQSTLQKKIINTLLAGLGRSVLVKTLPSVLSTALGLRPRFILKTSGTRFRYTDLPAGK